MSVLHDVQQAMVKDVFELTREGVNIQEYWTARMGLTDDDLREFLFEVVIKTARISRMLGHDNADLLMTIAAQSFTMGYIYGKKEEFLT